MDKYKSTELSDQALSDMESVFDEPTDIDADSNGMLHIAYALRALTLEVRLLRLVIETSQ